MNPRFIEVGHRVRVKDSGRYGNQIRVDMLGTVRKVYRSYSGYATNIAVEIDGIQNARASTGLFYFDPNKLEHVKECKGAITVMEGNYRIAVITGNVTLDKATVCACYDADIAQHDNCVFVIAGKYYIGEVSMFLDEYDQDITSEIVCKVDFTAYNERKELRERRNKLMEEMAARAASLQQIAVYKMLAESDPKMSEFMEEFMKIDSHLNK